MMTLTLAMLIGIACCMMLFYGPGESAVVVFRSDADLNSAIWFVVIAGLMLVVISVALSLPLV